MSIFHKPASRDIHDFRTANVFQLRVILIPEDNGYSALARDLPGVASQGNTIQEAVENIREAGIGAIEVYKDEGIPIPWTADHVDVPTDALQRWILIEQE
ncbi:MAG: type II toxin-antitoxin system HicB family antitoxin [Pirellulaceae bacterium]